MKPILPDNQDRRAFNLAMAIIFTAIAVIVITRALL